MREIKKSPKHHSIDGKRGKKHILAGDATRQEIEKAIKEYLEQGGKITKIEPEWIEDGQAYIF